MIDYSQLLLETYLFQPLSPVELQTLLSHLQPRYINADKGQLIGVEGQAISKIGVLLSGTLIVYKQDQKGNNHIIDKIQAGDIFAEAFVCARLPILPVTIEANSPVRVLWLDYQRLLTANPACQQIQMVVIRQLLQNTANKLINLKQKLTILQKSTIREKLLAYFALCAEKQHSQQVKLPFNRHQLADYLGVNRSALSRELSNMKQQGLISVDQDKIKLNLSG